MPGNDTLERGSFSSLQSAWRVGSIQANQVDKKIPICGCDNVGIQDVQSDCSIIVAVSRISNNINTGSVEFFLVVNGAKNGKSIVMDNTTGKKKKISFKPGKVELEKGDSVEIWYTSSADFDPLTIEAYISINVQWY